MTKNKAFYETDKFKKLKNEWDKKLEASGFVDIEKTETEEIIRPEVINLNSAYAKGPAYNDHCHRVLQTFQFKNEVDHFIFELHTNSKLTYRQMSDEIYRKFGRTISHVAIQKKIKRILELYAKGI